MAVGTLVGMHRQGGNKATPGQGRSTKRSCNATQLADDAPRQGGEGLTPREDDVGLVKGLGQFGH